MLQHGAQLEAELTAHTHSDGTAPPSPPRALATLLYLKRLVNHPLLVLEAEKAEKGDEEGGGGGGSSRSGGGAGPARLFVKAETKALFDLHHPEQVSLAEKPHDIALVLVEP
jgi:hypothetical protein